MTARDEGDTAPARDGLRTYALGRVLTPRGLVSLALAGTAVLGVAIAFAYTGGFLSPGLLTPTGVVDQFEASNGVHPGFRRNHTKGVCFSGRFDADGGGPGLSKAKVFLPGRVPVFGRFSVPGGKPYMPDTRSSVHSMEVNFTLPDGELWRIALIDIPVFGVSSVQDLVDELKATAPDLGTGKVDPAKLKAFMASHPDAARASAITASQPTASGFADASFNSLNAFMFVDAAGKATPVHWSMVAEDPFVAAEPSPTPSDPDYQFDTLIERIRQNPVRWRFVATVGQPGDPTSNPTLPWPADREKVPLGVMTVERLEDEAHGACRDVAFDPLILPAGIRPSDDPILSARSAAYANSFRRRSGEPAPVSAVRQPEAPEGARP